MNTLPTLESKIRPILSKYPWTRDSDKELALILWRDFYGVAPWTPIEDVLRNDKLPSIETIGRVRRKIQEREPGMRGLKRLRKEAEKDFRKYAKTDTLKGRM